MLLNFGPAPSQLIPFVGNYLFPASSVQQVTTGPCPQAIRRLNHHCKFQDIQVAVGLRVYATEFFCAISPSEHKAHYIKQNKLNFFCKLSPFATDH